MCTIAVIYEKSFYLDIAIIYALLSFSEIVAFLKFFPEE
jgi:multisubunit Na+/H+ antiporter MnhF subunit